MPVTVIRTALKTTIALLVLAVLIGSGAIQLDLLARLVDRPFSLLAAVLLTLALFPICAWRWHQLMVAADLPLPFRDVNRINYQSALVGLYLPGSVGADVAKLAMTNLHQPGRITSILSTLMVDRLLGLLSLLLIGLMALFVANLLTSTMATSQNRDGFAGDLTIYIGTALAVALIGFIAGVIVLGKSRQFLGWSTSTRLKRLADSLTRLHQGLVLYRCKPLLLMKGLVLSILGHLADFLALVIIADALFEVQIMALLYILAAALATVVSSVPITPGGLGLAEAAFAQLMDWLAPGNAGVPFATAYLAQRMIRILILVPGVLLPLRPSPVSPR